MTTIRDYPRILRLLRESFLQNLEIIKLFSLCMHRYYPEIFQGNAYDI